VRRAVLYRQADRHAGQHRPEDADLLKRYRDMDVARVVTTLPPEPAEKTLQVLDRWAELIRRVNA
jgi:hypothetical protein